MILPNNTKWTSSDLLGCGKANFEPLASGHFWILMSITALSIVWPVGHIEPHMIDWVTQPGQMPREFEPAI